MFSHDNTDGYSDGQLEELNAALAERLDREGLADDGTDAAKHAAWRVQTDYDREHEIGTINLADGRKGLLVAKPVATSEADGWQIVCVIDGEEQDCQIAVQDTLAQCRIAAQQAWGVGDWGLELIGD